MTKDCFLYLLTIQYTKGDIKLPPIKANPVNHPMISIPREPDVSTFNIDVNDIKKYMNPLVAAATLVYTFNNSKIGTITNPAPTPSIPAINPAVTPAPLSFMYDFKSSYYKSFSSKLYPQAFFKLSSLFIIVKAIKDKAINNRY